MARLVGKDVSPRSIIEKQYEAIEIVKNILNQVGTHAVLFSGSPASTVLLHLIRTVKGGKIPLLVFHLELIKGFSEIYQYLGKMERLWEFKVIREKNERLLDRMEIDSTWDELYGAHTRKPLNALFKKYRATHLFLPDYEKSQKEEMKGDSFRGLQGLTEVRPLIHFTIEDVWNYIQKNNLPSCSLFKNELEKVESDLAWRRPEGDTSQKNGTDTETLETAKKLKNLGYL